MLFSSIICSANLILGSILCTTLPQNWRVLGCAIQPNMGLMIWWMWAPPIQPSSVQLLPFLSDLSLLSTTSFCPDHYPIPSYPPMLPFTSPPLGSVNNHWLADHWPPTNMARTKTYVHFCNSVYHGKPCESSGLNLKAPDLGEKGWLDICIIFPNAMWVKCICKMHMAERRWWQNCTDPDGYTLTETVPEVGCLVQHKPGLSRQIFVTYFFWMYCHY